MLATLLQEKLQNAEDAGASEVRFVLDPLNYSSEKIMAPIPGRNDLTGMQVTEDKFHKKSLTLIPPHLIFTCISHIWKLTIPG